MSTTIGKLAPIAIVAAVVAWCCYPYLDKPASEASLQQEGNLPRIIRSLLSPIIEPASDRDPFKPREERNTDSTQSEQPATAATAETPSLSKEDILEILSNLVLDATFIQGNRRMALINGRVCEQGEPLAISGSITEPCIVTQISAHSVLIQYGDRTVELKYRNAVASANPSKLRRATP